MAIVQLLLENTRTQESKKAQAVQCHICVNCVYRLTSSEYWNKYCMENLICCVIYVQLVVYTVYVACLELIFDTCRCLGLAVNLNLLLLYSRCYIYRVFGFSLKNISSQLVSACRSEENAQWSERSESCSGNSNKLPVLQCVFICGGSLGWIVCILAEICFVKIHKNN